MVQDRQGGLAGVLSDTAGCFLCEKESGLADGLNFPPLLAALKVRFSSD